MPDLLLQGCIQHYDNNIMKRDNTVALNLVKKVLRY